MKIFKKKTTSPLDKHLVLIGYMGSGKTTVGKRLARHLKIPFLDLDAFIEGKYKMTISEIFSQWGEKKFRKIEHQTLLSVLKTNHPMVVSCGGGTPCFYDNITQITEHSYSIYLQLRLPHLIKRLEEEKQHRPLLKDKNREEMTALLEKSLRLRSPIYKQAHWTINNETENIQQTVEHILLTLAIETDEKKIG